MPQGHSPIVFIPLFIFFMCSTLGWGALVLRVSGLWKRMPDCLHILLFSGIVGVLFMGDLILLAGMAGRLERSILALLFLPGFIFFCHSVLLLRKSQRESPANKSQIQKDSSVSHQMNPVLLRYFFILSSPFVLLIFLNALVPDVSGDAYLYHITVPNYYALEGRIERVGISFCYNYPLQMEMYYLAGIRFGQEQAGVMMNLGLLLLTCAGIYLLGKRLGSDVPGLEAIFLFVSLPLVLISAPTSLVDITTGTFLIGSLLCLLHWKSSGEDSWLVLAGISAGGAVAIKLFIAPVPLVMFPLAIGAITGKMTGNHIRERLLSGKRGAFFEVMTRFALILVRNLSIYGAGMIIAFLPWMIKNALLTNNPFFPFLLKIFPTRPDLIASALVLFKMHGFPHFEGAGLTLQRILGIFPLLAWDANWLIIISLILTPVSFIRAVRNREKRVFWGIQFLMVLFILYYGKNAQVRWYLGLFPNLLMGFVLTVNQFLEHFPSLRRIVTFSLVAFILLIGARQYQLGTRESALYPWTGLSRKALERYIKERARVREAEFLNRSIPETGKVFLYDMEILSTGRWMRRRFVQAGGLWFESWEERKASPLEILKELQAMGVSHIASCHQENDSFRNFARSYLQEIKKGPVYSVYKILPDKKKE